MIRIVARTDPDFAARVQKLCDRAAAIPEEIENASRDVIRAVRAHGDAALRELTLKFEKRNVDHFELPPREWQDAITRIDPKVRAALEHAARRIKSFHENERYQSFDMEEAGGIRIGLRVAPLNRVGIYVPGGKALYPSTVLMTAIPARVAGVSEIIMTTPGASPETLAAAKIAGVDRVFTMGGAQAIAAMAYGTASVPRVDKIVGPGNAYVAAAKRLVFGDVGIDSIAGPTEVVIAADGSADPRWLAADLLAQAEHDELAVPILVIVGRANADRVVAALQEQLATLPRREIAAKALQGGGAVLVVDTTADAIDIVNRLAPEHAGLALADARAWASQVTTAGALFLGHFTPESVGDYIAGPSHVLPTSGSARFASPLGVSDFVKRTSVIEYDAAALQAQAADIERMAAAEGLDGHARAVRIRFSAP
ncbi:MAG: histidinol dehydrogenase [Deltaproteobacteria bacterium]|nr:histidinol dehydrogenase [Deltaproteobacteria bacterium]